MMNNQPGAPPQSFIKRPNQLSGVTRIREIVRSQGLRRNKHPIQRNKQISQLRDMRKE